MSQKKISNAVLKEEVDLIKILRGNMKFPNSYEIIKNSAKLIPFPGAIVSARKKYRQPKIVYPKPEVETKQIEHKCDDPLTNFCEPQGGANSLCIAEDRKNQEKCGFYELATETYRCMYNVFDKYCDCLEAQLKAKIK